MAADDDEEELPWQVIAILDIDILEQLAGGYEAGPARPGLARSRTQPLVAHERVTPVRAPGAR